MEGISMSEKEINRHEVLCRVVRGDLIMSLAAQMMHVSERQGKRLKKAFIAEGKQGLVHKLRGRKSNRAMPLELEQKIVTIIETSYKDFGPLLAQEKLLELHQISLSKEKLRQIMIAYGIHRPRKKKRHQVHQLRQRRDCIGELLQGDGSPHAWFEDRGSPCTLLALIDDASGEVSGRFEESEATDGYFRLVQEHITQHGRPLELYVDKHGIFRVNVGVNRSEKTQFTRAMNELDIKVTCANSPQAKGRIERLFKTLQDRLVKELRIRNISTIEGANAFLPEFFRDYNKRFKHEPQRSHNAHRPLKQGCDLNTILCHKESRVVSKNLEIRYENHILQIEEPNKINRLKGKLITVLKTMGGEILLEHQGDFLKHKEFREMINAQPEVKDRKQMVIEWERQCAAKVHKSSPHTPWHRFVPHPHDVGSLKS